MFNWKVENMALRDEVLKKDLKWNNYEVFKTTYSVPYIFDCENAVTREEKVVFVDKMTEGKLGYILNLVKKFNEEKDTMPKDSYNEVRTLSLKAWLKRNDYRQAVDNRFRYGQILFFDKVTYIHHLNNLDDINKYVDCIFHKQLVACLNEEMEYFAAHDEYSVLTEEIKHCIGKTRNYETYLETRNIIKCETSSYGTSLYISDKDGTKRKLSLEELKEVKEDFKEIDAFMVTLAQRRQQNCKHYNINDKSNKRNDYSR